MSAPPASTSSATTSLLVRAMRRQPVERTPVWFMRQAGRSLPEYRAVRAGIGMLDACTRPDLVTEITLQPVRRHGVDAAILFSDIMVPLKAAGVDLDITAGVGPVVASPVRTAADVAALPALDPAQVGYVDRGRADAGRGAGRHAAGRVRRRAVHAGQLPGRGRAVPGARADQGVHARRAGRVVGAAGHGWPRSRPRSCGCRSEAGAAAIQLFDSWAGALSARDYARFVQPHSAAVFAALADLDVPKVHFGVGTGELLGLMGEAGADVVGVDWRVPLDEASRRVGPARAVQGNLDPALLLADWPVVEAEVRRVLAEGRAAPGHVFNLGHGVLPETDPTMLTRVVQLVHSVPR